MLIELDIIAVTYGVVNAPADTRTGLRRERAGGADRSMFEPGSLEVLTRAPLVLDHDDDQAIGEVSEHWTEGPRLRVRALTRWAPLLPWLRSASPPRVSIRAVSYGPLMDVREVDGIPDVVVYRAAELDHVSLVDVGASPGARVLGYRVWRD